MEIKELYAMKGEIITQMEILQQRLQMVNNEIIKKTQENAVLGDKTPN